MTELGRRYGQDARVWGWQLDNELTSYGKEPCFCAACQGKFQGWLKTKYGTITALNRDWGNGLWLATNSTENSQPAPIPTAAKILLGTREVPIAGVTAWRE